MNNTENKIEATREEEERDQMNDCEILTQSIMEEGHYF